MMNSTSPRPASPVSGRRRRRRWGAIVCVGLALVLGGGCDSDGGDGTSDDTAVVADGSGDTDPGDVDRDANADAKQDSAGDVDIDAMTLDACTVSCAGRECGDDGCGGTCGECRTGESCTSGGVCTSDTCEPGCTSDCEPGCWDVGSCTPAGSADIATTPSIFTAGLVLTIGGAAETAEVYYREPGAETWWRGHDMTDLPDGRLASALFQLGADTEYEVMAVEGSNVGCASFRTLPETPGHSASTTLFVEGGATGGDGSEGAPLGSIQAAVDSVPDGAGADIVVRPGVYRESVDLAGRSGAEGAYIRVLGEPGAILDGSDPDATEPSWTADGPNVWTTPWTGAPSYVSRDGARLYHYLDLQGLRDGIGDDGVAIDEGWFFEGGVLYVRSLTDPSGHAWQLPMLGVAVRLDASAWVWIEGLEIRHFGEGQYPKGIDVRSSEHVVVRNNHIYATPAPVWVRKGASHVRVESNEIHQSTVPSWPWAAVKGTDHENSAITLAGGTSLIARDNVIYDIFNGIGSGSFGDAQNPDIAFDVDVFGNRLARITDDGLEPEGACINNRFWGNVVDRVHNGISLAPITYGPVWVLRNRFTDYTQSGFKVSNDSSGRVWLYHNTCWVDRADQNGMGVSGYFENMVFRNNVVRGTRYALEMSRAAGPNDLDYDNWYTTRGAPVIKWDDVRYDSLDAWCAATGLECNGQPLDPQLVDPSGGRFGPSSTSPNIDAGERLHGINDSYTGDAPDIGYVEAGASEPAPVP